MHDNTRLHIKLIYQGCDKFEQIKLESLHQYRAKMKISGTALPWTGMVVVSSYHLFEEIQASDNMLGWGPTLQTKAIVWYYFQTVVNVTQWSCRVLAVAGSFSLALHWAEDSSLFKYLQIC